MPEDNKDIPLFSYKDSQKIGEEMGLDSDDPNIDRIAATEMGYANETPTGEINATQTACPTLKYGEALPPSKGAEEGKKKTESELKDFLDKKGLTDVDEWIKRKSRKK